MMKTDKTMTEEQALQRLADQCARTECSTGDIDAKMRRWGFGPEARKRVTDYLVGHKYVDNERYCRAFVNDKIRFNHWGRRKIEQALWTKQVPQEVSGKVLDDIDDEEYLSVLKPMLKSKWPTIKAATDYERSLKLMKFALGRGFSMELIRRCLPAIDGEEA